MHLTDIFDAGKSKWQSMRNYLILILLIAASHYGKAQDKTGFHIAAGPRVALPVSDLGDLTTFGIGGEVQLEYRFIQKLSAIVSSGYTSFIGEEFAGYKFQNVSYIPVLGGFRYYPLYHAFIGAKAGYGVLSSGGTSAGAFNFEPHVGYNSKYIQAYISYNSLSAKGIDDSHVGLTILYKIF
jgi:hypothetical protein